MYQPKSPMIYLISVLLTILQCCSAHSELARPLSDYLTNTTGMTNTSNVTVTTGRLAIGNPSYLWANNPMANQTFMNESEVANIELDAEGIRAFTEQLNKNLLSDQSGNKLLRRDGQLYSVAEVNGIVAAMLGISTNIVTRDEEECRGQYKHGFTNTLKRFFFHDDSALKMNWKEALWSTATWFIHDISGWAQEVLAFIDTVMSGSTKKACNGAFNWVNVNDEDGKTYTYAVSVSPWTSGKNCDTTARNEVLQEAFALAESEAHIEDATGWCTSLTHSGTWHVDVRIMRWEEGYFCDSLLANIQCESFDF